MLNNELHTHGVPGLIQSLIRGGEMKERSGTGFEVQR
jgi:hypothetical protein